MIRRLATVALALVLIFTAGLGVVLWLGGREVGLHWIVRQVVQMSDGALTVDGAKGSLYGPLRIGRMAFEAPPCAPILRIWSSIGRPVS